MGERADLRGRLDCAHRELRRLVLAPYRLSDRQPKPVNFTSTITMMDKPSSRWALLVALFVIVSVLLSALFSWDLPWKTKDQMVVDSFEGMMSATKRTDLMRSMMGAQNADGVPIRKTAERTSSLVPVVKEGVKEFRLSASPVRWEYQTGKTL